MDINTDNLYDPSYNETEFDRLTEHMTDEEVEDYVASINEHDSGYDY
jgi:hypothetical protein